MKKLIFWEMNEINYEFLSYYFHQGKLNNLKKFIEAHGYYSTISEKKYEELEPWIQWPTIRTGLEYKEHKVFRLGDMDRSGLKQHWEILEENGHTVAAVIPINAANNTQNSPFWIPDPWGSAKISGDSFAHRFTKAVRQAVNDNAQEKLNFQTLCTLAECLLTKTKLSSWPTYANYILGALKKQHWSKALMLDRMLADLFITLWEKHQPDFSVLFLNGGAHLQHHYMCSSPAYTGKGKNPSWYLPTGKDPLYEIYALYDSILGDLLKLPNTRLMIATGLQQIPREQATYYWRLKNHSEFLTKIGIDHSAVHLRMTRDFLIEFNSTEAALTAEARLKQAVCADDVALFEEVDNRGKDIYVTLTYPHDIGKDFSININGHKYTNFEQDVVFVAIKNGNHDSQGFFLDNQLQPGELDPHFAIKDIFTMVLSHFGVELNDDLPIAA